VATEAKAQYGDGFPAKPSRELREHAPWTMATAAHAVKKRNGWNCIDALGHDEKAKQLLLSLLEHDRCLNG
jgi:hypothetical protein